MSTTTVQAPEPSAEESAIYSEILSLITQQQAWNQMMMPEYAHQMHYKIQEAAGEAPAEMYTQQSEYQEKYDYWQDRYNKYKDAWQANPSDTGSWKKYKEAEEEFSKIRSQLNILNDRITTYEETTSQEWVKMTDEEWYNDPETTDTERAQWDAYQAQLERYNKALAGEIPLTETMINQKQSEFEQLKQTFPTISGSSIDDATATDTIGIQNLNEFKKRWAEVEEAQRYGELSTAAQSTIGLTGLTTDLARSNIGTLAAIGGDNTSTISQYGSLLQPYMAYTQAGYQAQAANAATQASMYGSLLGLGGMLGGALLASSKKYKTNIKAKTKRDEDKALIEMKKTKSYEYEYKPEMKLGSERHLGTLTEESPKEYVTAKGDMVNLGDKLEFTNMAIKALDRKIDTLHSIGG